MAKVNHQWAEGDLVSILPGHGPCRSGVGRIVKRLKTDSPHYFVTAPPDEGLPILVHQDHLDPPPPSDTIPGQS